MGNLTVIGLVYDIIGVCILAVALTGISRRELFWLAGTYWDGNKALFRAFLLQRTDTRFGLLFLVAGFVLQLAGAFGLDMPLNGLWFWLLVLALMSIAYLFVRQKTSEGSDRQFDKWLARAENQGQENNPRP